MGRKAGVAAETTRAALLESAAAVFARRGYDGASISEICSEAGLTSGAIYAHYASKAELFVAALKVYGDRDLDRVLRHGRGADLLEALTSIGAEFDRPQPTEASLVIAAIVAARHHREVHKLISVMMADREFVCRAIVDEAQTGGVLSSEVSAATLSRMWLMLALGSLVVGALPLEPLEHQEWADFMAKLVGRFAGPSIAGSHSAD